MTREERDDLMIRVDERLKNIEKDLKEYHREMHGNGKPGLIERVQKLENESEIKRRHHGSLVLGMGLLINAIGVLYAIFKKANA